MYTQNKEEKYITEYFAGKKGVLLSIGENDGKTFSNSLRLLELGWRGVLVEPSPSAFLKMRELHATLNSDVMCVQVAIGNENKTVTLHESGPHFKDKSDYSLLSTTKESEKQRWKGTVEFNPIEVEQITYDALREITNENTFDFITIDAEGLDVDILKQIDLSATQMVCVEWNSIEADKNQIIDYCRGFGLVKEIYVNGENIILAK